MAKKNIGDVLREAGGALGAFGTQRKLSRQEEEEEERRRKAEILTGLLLKKQGIEGVSTQGIFGPGGITPQGLGSLLPQQEPPDKPPKIKTFPGTVGGKPAVANIRVDEEGVVEFPEDFVPTEKKEKEVRPRADEVYTPQEAIDDVGRWIKGLLPGIPPTPGQKALIGKGLDVIYEKERNGRKFTDEEIDIWLEGAKEEEDIGDGTQKAGFFKNIFTKVFGRGTADATKDNIPLIATKEEYDKLDSGVKFREADSDTVWTKP